MATLLSGSFGQNSLTNACNDVEGALVYVKSQRSLGYVINPIDNNFDVSMNRFNIWIRNDKFGTFLDDVLIIQLITGSF